MLKEIVNSEEWRRINEQNQTDPFPDRLKQIAGSISTSDYIHRVLKNRNYNTFVYMLDCLQATSNKTKMKEIWEFLSRKVLFMGLHYVLSTQVFERFIKYYDIKYETLEWILVRYVREENQPLLRQRMEEKRSASRNENGESE